MGMTPEEYLESFVQGNLEDCQEEPGDLRRAFNAAVSASHLADHYYTYNRRHHPERVQAFGKVGNFVEHLANETSGAFRDLRSISNVYKHLYTGPQHLARATILSGGALASVRSDDPGDTVELVDAEYVEGPDVISGRLIVVFKRKDGSTSEFLPVLESFVTYWYGAHAYKYG